MVRRIRAAVMVASATAMGLLSTSAIAAPCWRPPVDGVVVDAFREPACIWCAGNRGIEYSVEPGRAVIAAASGRVTFVGEVVGTTYVVVESADGWLLTYGRLAGADVRADEVIIARRRIGETTGDFFFGVRVDGTYVDPGPFLGRLVGRRRLIPVDGSPARPTPPAELTCRVTATRR